MTLKPDPLLVNLLDAAGYTLAPHRDGQTWVATHQDTGQQVAGDDPGPVACDALRLLRQQLADMTHNHAGAAEARDLVNALTAEVAELRAELESARAQAQDAAQQLERMTQGERRT